MCVCVYFILWKRTFNVIFPFIWLMHKTLLAWHTHTQHNYVDKAVSILMTLSENIDKVYILIKDWISFLFLFFLSNSLVLFSKYITLHYYTLHCFRLVHTKHTPHINGWMYSLRGGWRVVRGWLVYILLCFSEIVDTLYV